jgi:glutamate decarboxylase
MPLLHPKTPRAGRRSLSLNPLFVGEGLKPVPRNELPADGIDPDLAYQIIHDELLLDGNARLNLATFVGTWMEPQAQKLYAETYDKNMIDKD